MPFLCEMSSVYSFKFNSTSIKVMCTIIHIYCFNLSIFCFQNLLFAVEFHYLSVFFLHQLQLFILSSVDFLPRKNLLRNLKLSIAGNHGLFYSECLTFFNFVAVIFVDTTFLTIWKARLGTIDLQAAFLNCTEVLIIALWWNVDLNLPDLARSSVVYGVLYHYY